MLTANPGWTRASSTRFVIDHVDEADVVDQATVVPALEEMIETLRSKSAVRLQ
ncbi:hypothetical protein [Mycobacterium sp. HUMS_1102779]|uniref:hypothetical protein n=1 Tax=Mycobacterium sp. HUMS_1102779 TaxID=3383487 RepID=UPI00389A60D4